MPTCRLCDQDKELCKSHIMPRFVLKWLKDTSATRRIRFMAKPGQLTQDGLKPKLLCDSCEGLLNRWETLFATSIFWPYHKKEQNVFEYDRWLVSFLISINWRMLVYARELGKHKQLPNYVVQGLSQAEYRMKKYLFGQKSKLEEYQYNLIFVDFIESATGTVPPGLTRYLGRGVDMEVVFKNRRELWVYIKLGKIISVTILRGEKLEEWRDSRVLLGRGRITAKQQICGKLGAWVLKRSQEVRDRLSSTQTPGVRDKFWEKVMQDPDAFMRSETFRSYLEEFRLTGSFPEV